MKKASKLTALALAGLMILSGCGAKSGKDGKDGKDGGKKPDQAPGAKTDVPPAKADGKS